MPGYQTPAGITQITDSQNNNLVGRFVPDVAGMVAFSGFVVRGQKLTRYRGQNEPVGLLSRGATVM